MPEDQWIWVTRWEDFQHYSPRRDQGPAWIKNHAAQLQDERYLSLSGFDRGVLHGIRLGFSQARCKLPAGTRQLSQRLSLKITAATLERLSDAGFIEILSRAERDAALEAFYASRAPARSREKEKEKEVLVIPPAVSSYEGGRALTDDDYEYDPEVGWHLGEDLAAEVAEHEQRKGEFFHPSVLARLAQGGTDGELLRDM